MKLSSRLDRLEQGGEVQETIFIWIEQGESMEQAKDRWLKGHPDREADLERPTAQVRFVQHVFVDVPEQSSLREM